MLSLIEFLNDLIDLLGLLWRAVYVLTDWGCKFYDRAIKRIKG